jgi:hypothetical protein
VAPGAAGTQGALVIRVGLAVAPGKVRAGPTLLFCLPAHVTSRHATSLTLVNPLRMMGLSSFQRELESVLTMFTYWGDD